jgi:hypothetical protein
VPAQKIRDLELYKLLQLDRFEEDLRISRVRLGSVATLESKAVGCDNRMN